MILTLLKLLFLFFGSIRLLRWLAISQQTEYRLDRWWLFFKSEEGVKDYWNLIPHPKTFSRSRLKRPVFTKRALIIGLISALLYMVPLFSADFNFFNACITYLAIPFMIIIVALPTSIIRWLATHRELKLARQKIKQSKPIVIGITGSYGKTSTKQLLAHVLSQKFSVFSTPKSFNDPLSFPKSINNGYFGQEIMVLEYAAYAQGEIAKVAKYIQPNIAVITGLTPQHLGIFGTVEAIIKAKGELIKSLSHKSKVFYNGSDPGTLKICLDAGAQNPIDYSGEKSDIKFSQVKLSSDGKLHFIWNSQTMNTQLIGRHYLDSVKAVVAICSNLGLSQQQIVEGIISFKPSSNFIRTKIAKTGVLVVDDGKTSNPKGFEAALEIVKELKPSLSTICIITSGIVDLGKMSSQIHAQLALKTAKAVQKVFYTGVIGAKDFKTVFKDALITDQETIKHDLVKLKQGDLLLIEGRIPQHITKLINEL